MSINHTGEDIDDDEYFDANDVIQDKEDLYFFDAMDKIEPAKTDKVLHLTKDYQTIAQDEKERKTSFINKELIDEVSIDINYYESTGHNEKFNPLIYAISAVERLQKLEDTRPHLAWKPINIIEKMLEKTTQLARTITQYPMQKHHISHFPWNNCNRLY